ncbi:MAG: hypothetical protein IPN17_16770 [Deltaproteobacteria bacterium]|nr:hypothetical protein [Deltaproteobacteria bacterium]
MRASANFPLAFLLILVRSPGPIPGHAQIGDPTRTRLTDGGVRINSGVDPLYYLMLSHRESDPPTRRGAGGRRRDGGEPLGRGCRASGRSSPRCAASSVSNVQRLHRVMVTRLAAEFGGRLGACASTLSPRPLRRADVLVRRRAGAGAPCAPTSRATAGPRSGTPRAGPFDAVGATTPEESDEALVEGRHSARPSLQ